MSGVLGEMVAAEVPAGLGKYRKVVRNGGAVSGVLGEMVAAEVPAGLGKYRKVVSEWRGSEWGFRRNGGGRGSCRVGQI